MSIYARYKRDPDGFRKLVELLESVPSSRRQKMIDAGMKEDEEYTSRAIEYILTMQDILELPEAELIELISKTPARIVAYSIQEASQDVQEYFVECADPRKRASLKEELEKETGPTERGGAQMKLIEAARELERNGVITVKKIPIGNAWKMD